MIKLLAASQVFIVFAVATLFSAALVLRHEESLLHKQQSGYYQNILTCAIHHDCPSR